MRNSFCYCVSIIFLFSCTNTKNITSTSSPVENHASSSISLPVVSEKDPREITITVDNPTVFNVYFDGDPKKMIRKKSKGDTVTLLIENTTLTGGFNILYEIPLSDTVSLFCKGDHRTIREKQSSFIIVEPQLDGNYGTYITIRNRANNAISFYTGGTANPAWEQRGNPKTGNNFTWTDKREFSPGETAVFDISRDFGFNNYFIRDGRENIPLVLPLNVKRNYLYTFTYTTQGVHLTDSRPLHRIGEKSWVKTPPEIPEAISPIPLVVANGEIHTFIPINNGLFRYTFDSAGNAKETAPIMDNFTIKFATFTGNVFFIAGYEEGNYYRPIANIYNMDGTIQRPLSPSERFEYGSAFFNTAAAYKDSTWLVAGGAMSIKESGHLPAYIRLIRDNGHDFDVEWERGITDFDKNTQGAAKCGEVKCAVYDVVRSRWLISGVNREYDAMGNLITGSYIAFISLSGDIQNPINTSFNKKLFSKILTDNTNGDYYLIGEEEKGNKTYALIIKYNAKDEFCWQLPVQPWPHSYYQDAILDIENDQIVAGGTMQASDNSGNDGIPFIEGINLKDGAGLWREQLTSFEFKQTRLVTAIAHAPDYGFVITLSNRNNGYAQPYKIARLNSRGKLLNNTEDER